MALEDRVAKLESDMFHLMCGSVKLPKSAFYDSTLSFSDWALPILYGAIVSAAFMLGAEIEERVEHLHAARGGPPASARGPVCPPGHDTPDDPR